MPHVETHDLPALAEAQVTSRSAVRTIFEQRGKRMEVGSDRPFALAGDQLWLVDDGFLDIFLVLEGADGGLGQREHIARVQAEGFVCGFGDIDERGIGLIAVGAADTRLWKISRAELSAVTPRDHEMEEAIARGIVAMAERWAVDVFAGLVSEAGPRTGVEVTVGSRVELEDGAIARPGHEVVWVRGQGRLLLAGRPTLALGSQGALPVYRKLWLRAEGHCVIEAIDPLTLGESLWESLAQLQQLAMVAARDNAERAGVAQLRRRVRRAEENEAALGGALHSLASAMRLDGGGRRELRGRPREQGTYEMLLSAMRRVGGEVGVTITPPANFSWAGIEEPVDAVARSSHCRTRRVLLARDWWKGDAGPLLGFMHGEGSREAVALLPLPAGGYAMHRKAHLAARITPATAGQLIPHATSIYRPFPPTPLGLGAVLRFALRGTWRDILTVGVLGAAGGALAMVIPFSIGLLFDTVIPSADRSQLVQLTAILVVVALASMCFELVRTIALLRVEGRMQVTVQAALWDRLLSLPASFFRTYTAGELATRAMSIDGIRQLLTGTVTTAVVSGIFSIFNFGMMFAYNSALAWRGTALIASLLLVTLLTGWLQLRAQREVSLMRARTSGLVLQLLTSVAKLRVAGAEVRAFAIWARQFGEQRRQQFISRFVRNGYATINSAFPCIALIVIFGAATAVMQADTAAAARGAPPAEPLRTGDFLAFLAAFSACLAGTLATGTSFITAAAIVPLYEQARPIFAARPEVGEFKLDAGVLEGDIEAQHLSFRYLPDAPLVLNDLSFRIRPGECVALVGPSGSGKTSIIRALLGFESLESGSIYIDGHELSGLDIQSVRRQVGVVLQYSRLNSGDIYANIVGSSLATEEDAWAAAEMAGLAEDIREMPMGMNTVVSEGGGTLSGGQRQRLMIARAFVRRPKIVLFDEATSALDNHAQAIVSESLANLRATRIIVAHRLSTIMTADRILVVKAGRIIENGSYGELMEREGAFTELARRQLA